MKYSVLPILAIVFTSLFAFTIPAKKISNGIVEFDIAVSGEILESNPMAASMFDGSTMTMSFNDNFVKVETNMGVTNTIAISNLETEETTLLMNIMGQRYKLAQPNSEEDDPEVSYEVTEESKTIAGYECTKVIVSQEEGDLEVWVTEGIQPSNYKGKGYLKELPGFPLEYSIDRGQIQLHFTAKKVSDTKLGDEKFAIPDGYTETTAEELQQKFGGMGF